MFRSALIFCVSVLIIASSLQEEYCWREYTGSIPADAVVGGKDINGNDVYIGQAYLKDAGLVVAQIYPGVKEVYVPYGGVKKVGNYIKILCGPQENFYWMPASASNLHLALVDKDAVIGGHQDNGGQLNIGRIKHEGEIKIGKVAGFRPESAHFYYNDKEIEKFVSSMKKILHKPKSTGEM